MMSLASLALIVFYCLGGESLAQEVFRWVDEKGTIHFADNPHSVPEQYRQESQKRYLPSSVESTPPLPVTNKDQPTPSRTEKYNVPLIRESGLLLVDGLINNQTPVRFIVDTGANQTMIPVRLASRLGLNPEESLLVALRGVGGVVDGKLIEIDSVKVGNAEVTNLDVVVADEGPQAYVLLGTDFLSRFQIDIRHSSNQILFQPGQGPYDGYPAKWWQERFRRYDQLKQTYRQRIKKRKEELRSAGINPDHLNWEGSVNSSSYAVQVISRDIKDNERYLKILDNKIADLELRASRAEVPRDLRE